MGIRTEALDFEKIISDAASSPYTHAALVIWAAVLLVLDAVFNKYALRRLWRTNGDDLFRHSALALSLSFKLGAIGAVVGALVFGVLCGSENCFLVVVRIAMIGVAVMCGVWMIAVVNDAREIIDKKLLLRNDVSGKNWRVKAPRARFSTLYLSTGVILMLFSLFALGDLESLVDADSCG